jgi:hypothetical protein
MSRSDPSRVAVLLFAAATLAGCHAHGNQGVTTVDHGVTVTFTRHMTDISTVELSFKNATPDAVCLAPASFDPASFSVKTDKGIMPSRTPLSPASAACGVLAPGAEQSRSVDAGEGFSRLDLQTGAVCYRYAFSQSPAGPTAWQAAGMICE